RGSRLFSIPSRWGIRGALRIALVSHLLTIAALFSLWHFAGFGPIFLAGVIAVSFLLIYEHSLVSADNLTRVNIAFFNVNSIVSFGLLTFGVADLLIAK
ncbi:MAG: 4-hydroxybenzoate octaprenyltransferase, partial [Planctomycetota bacterium]|nr:4-hydroxybenzoate octaprenyltransferase [Planctomycetota bacterium]